MGASWPRRAAWASVLALAGCAGPTLGRFEYDSPRMGTTFALVLYAPDRASADRAAGAAFARIDELDAILSDYDPRSELSRLARSTPGVPVRVSRELWEVLRASADLAVRSGGAFDVTVGPYVRLWRRARRQGELPSPARLAEARRSVGHGALILDERGRTANLAVEGMGLDLGGIAKGYTLDAVLRELRSLGIERALVDGGGDVAAGAPPPGSDGWRVGCATPLLPTGARAHVRLAHAAVATSGDTESFLEIDGVRYSHLIDPATGLGLTRRVGATVLAPDGMTADALASVLCVLEADEGIALAEATPGVEARIVTLEGGRSHVRDTSGLAAALSWDARPGPEPKGRQTP